MTIYQPGCSICYGPDFGLHGEVNRVSITRGNRVEYEVMYWQNGEPKFVWMHADQLKENSGTRTARIGFAAKQ